VEVVPTDQLFWRWCDRYHPKETVKVRQSLGRYFPYLSQALRHKWFTYFVRHVLSVAKYAHPDLVVEGWLLTRLPTEMKDILRQHANLMTVTMRAYGAHTDKKVFKPVNKNYFPVVSALRDRLTRVYDKLLMPKARKHRFEDRAYSIGKSDCLARLDAFQIPTDLSGKTVLDWECENGYFATRFRQRGADVTAVSASAEQAELTSRIANAIYRMSDIRCYHGDLMTENFKKPKKFDYVLLSGNVNDHQDPSRLFERAKEFLAPGGRLIVEACMQGNQDPTDHVVPVVQKDGSTEFYFSETWLRSCVGPGLVLQSNGPSVHPSDPQFVRKAYHFILR
jgi:SAM-dependent methyltransferase